MIMAGVAVRFFIVYELAPGVRREGIAQITGWMERGIVRHAIAARFPLAEIAQAHEAVEQGSVIGNVVVTI